MTAATPEPTSAPASRASEAETAGSEQRFARLSEGVRKIRSGAKRINWDERMLMILGGILAPLGLVLVFVGWYGAAHSPYLFQQIPYLISGGLLGLGLVFLGGFLYFAHWVTESVKEQRRQTTELVDAIARLESVMQRSVTATTNGRANGVAAANGVGDAHGEPAEMPERAGLGDEPLELVATMRGTVAHRLDCVVVAGKVGVRPVAEGERLGACRLCDPYAQRDEAATTS